MAAATTYNPALGLFNPILSQCGFPDGVSSIVTDYIILPFGKKEWKDRIGAIIEDKPIPARYYEWLNEFDAIDIHEGRPNPRRNIETFNNAIYRPEFVNEQPYCLGAASNLFKQLPMGHSITIDQNNPVFKKYALTPAGSGCWLLFRNVVAFGKTYMQQCAFIKGVNGEFTQHNRLIDLVTLVVAKGLTGNGYSLSNEPEEEGMLTNWRVFAHTKELMPLYDGADMKDPTLVYPTCVGGVDCWSVLSINESPMGFKEGHPEIGFAVIRKF